MAVQMTRAEYEAKYGKPPASQAAPVKMTQAQYDAKYKTLAPAAAPQRGFLENLVKRPIERLVMEPGRRLGEAVGSGLVNLFGNDEQKQSAAQTTQQDATIKVPLLGDFLTRGVKSGNEGGKQIIDEAVESTLNIAPLPVGKLLKPALNVAKNVLPGATRSAEKLVADALDVTTRPFNKKATVSALERSGRPGGFGESTSPLGKLTGRTEYIPSDYDKRLAQSVADVVSPTNSPVRNIQSINTKIAKVSEEQVTPLLQSNPGIFNTKTYNVALKRIEPPDYVKTDATLERTYDLVRERFIDVASKHPKTKLGLWEARKELDSILEEQFGRGVFDPEKYSVFQRAVADMRRATNDFINEGTDDAFKANMRQLSDMFEARSRVALDGYRLANSNRFSRWMAENPKKTKAIELILGGGAAAGFIGTVLGD